MELRQYIRIIVGGWWLIIPITLLSFVTSMFFSYTQTPIYEATSTYVAQLNNAVDKADGMVYALDTLSGRDRIFVTFCNIMESEAVRTRAFELMNLDQATIPNLQDYSIKCNVLPTSNVLLLIVRGPSDDLIVNLNQAVGLAGMERANNVFGVFQVGTLDPVKLEPEPISPSHSRSAVLGAALGIVISVTLAIMLDYLRSPLEKIEAQAIRDGLLNVYNDRYFNQRLSEEIRRSRARQRPLSIAMTKLVPTEDFELLPESVQESIKRQVAQFMQERLGDSDLLAFNRKADTFEMILAETNNSESRQTLVQMHHDVQARSFRANDYIANFTLTTGVVESSGENLQLGRMIEKSNKALSRAQQSVDSPLIYLRDAPNPFVVEGTDPAVEEYTEVPLIRITVGASVTQEIDAILASENGYSSATRQTPSDEDMLVDQEAFDRLFSSKPSDNGKDKNEKFTTPTTSD